MDTDKENIVLTKIEKLVDTLNYKSVNITIVTKQKTITLEKEKETKVRGFK